MRPQRDHPFARQWNHNTHYYPLLASRLPPEAGRLLDVGCGDGTFARYVAHDRRPVVGAELDRAVLPTASDGVGYVVTSAETLPFIDGTFSAVTMTMVLHHVDTARALSEATRVLTPGGVLLVLGIGRYGGWRDAWDELRDVVTHRARSRGMQPWEPPTTQARATETWADVRRTTTRLLPGSTYRRLRMWRYLVEWRRPLEP